jgi:toxin-antitoxin system PIN domain toxin
VHLLDVNVLVALFDERHVHHEAAHAWFAAHRSGGWATCPLTENGFLRVVSNPAYAGNRVSIEQALKAMIAFCADRNHRFWPDSASLRDGILQPRHVSGHRHLTDAYLLALAHAQRGALATLDRGLDHRAVSEARAEELVRIL